MEETLAEVYQRLLLTYTSNEALTLVLGDVQNMIDDIDARVEALEGKSEPKRSPRVDKLLSKGEYFLVIAKHEPYFDKAYSMIREQEQKQGTWTADDEKIFTDNVSQPEPDVTGEGWIPFDYAFPEYERVYWVWGSILEDDDPYALPAKWSHMMIHSRFKDKLNNDVYDVKFIANYDPAHPEPPEPPNLDKS